MFDVWAGDIELTVTVLIFSVVVFLPVQLLLCFKVKSRIIRLLPVIVLAVLTVFFVVKSVTNTDWEAFGNIFLAVYSGLMLLVCGVGWGIWAVSKVAKRAKII